MSRRSKRVRKVEFQARIGYIFSVELKLPGITIDQLAESLSDDMKFKLRHPEIVEFMSTYTYKFYMNYLSFIKNGGSQCNGPFAQGNLVECYRVA